jgi:membrane fusion protein (multidrug efflux system)
MVEYNMHKLIVNYKKFLNKPMWTMLICVAVLFGSLFIWKAVNAYLIVRQMRNMVQPTIAVSTTKVNFTLWQPTLKAVGTLRAILGINLTTELPGLVQNIHFLPGADTKKGELLLQVNSDTELAQLKAAEAQVELAKITYARDKLQYLAHGVSQQTLETDLWNLKKQQAQAEEAKVSVQKKTIYAPFAGRLGISQVSSGQYIKPGDIITTLQTFHPIYIDFYLPQQALRYLKAEQSVVVSTDVFPKKKFLGKLTTIEPQIDIKTSNVKLEATVSNPQFILLPGMYVSIEIKAQKPKQYLTLPLSAISFDSFGEFVFLVKKKLIKNKTPQFFVEQIYVTTGMTRENEVAVMKGIKLGDVVVTGGQLKLKSGDFIKIISTPS